MNESQGRDGDRPGGTAPPADPTPAGSADLQAATTAGADAEADPLAVAETRTASGGRHRPPLGQGIPTITVSTPAGLPRAGRDAASPAGETSRLAPGTKIGRFEIEACVGSGGMGVVYAATDHQLKRKIAIKLIRDREGHTNLELNERLLREAQTLAPLSHPNVVAVHDVGHYRGEPYIAMEYVDGVTLREWLDAEPHSWREIVDIFVQAGRGLAAAHAAGVVHRDFKPTNVLIADGRARVVDFGLARPSQTASAGAAVATPATGADSETSTLTHPGAIMGTPRYMAPEQRTGGSVDGRTDQYSFCVTLGEALYHDLPEADAALPAIPRLPGRIQAALSRGLHADPERRYPDMAGLLADLGVQPISAARRYAPIAIALLGIMGVAGGMWLRHQRATPCRDARQHLAGAWDAERRAEIATAFAASGRSYAAATFTSVAGQLDRYGEAWVAMHTEACAATRIRGEQSADLLDRRMICLSRRLTVLRGLTELLAHADVDLVDNAVTAVSRLPDLDECADRERLLTMVAPPDAALRDQVAALREQLDRGVARQVAGDYRGYRDTALAVVEQSRAVAYPPLRAEALLEAGLAAAFTGEAEAAATTLRAALIELARARDDEGTARALTSLLFVLGLQLGRVDDALLLLPIAQAAVARIGDDPELQGKLERAVGILRRQQGRYPEAQEQFQHAYDHFVASQGEQSNAALTSLSDLANILADQGQLKQAITRYERLIAVREAQLGPDHPTVATALDNAGTVLTEMGELDRALDYHQRALASREQVYGPDSEAVAATLHNLGWVYAERGDRKPAEAAYRRSLTIRTRDGGSPLRVAHTMTNLGSVLADDGNLAEAGELYQRALELRQTALGLDHPEVAESLFSIGALHARQGHLAEARAHFESALARGGASWGPDTVRFALVTSELAHLDVEQKRYRAAIPRLEKALEIYQRTGVDTLRIADTHFDLARARFHTGEPSRAFEVLAQAAEEYRALGPRGETGVAKVEGWRKAAEAATR